MDLVPLRFGVHYGTGAVSKAIQWQQRCECSHISIVDNDDRLIEAREWRGVVAERSLAEARKDTRVDVLFVLVTPEMHREALSWARTQLGKQYDYAAILRFVTRKQSERTDNGKWFCSEYAFVASQKAGVTLLKRVDPVNVSPGHFILSPYLTEETATP